MQPPALSRAASIFPRATPRPQLIPSPSPTCDEKRAFVALWNASEIVELDLVRGTVARKLALLKPSNPIAAGTHPCAFAFSPDEKTLYVALANRDAVAAVNVSAGRFSVKGYYDTRLPGQSYFGVEPVALAIDAPRLVPVGESVRYLYRLPLLMGCPWP